MFRSKETYEATTTNENCARPSTLVAGRNTNYKERIATKSTQQSLPWTLQNMHSPTQLETGAHFETIELAKNKLNVRYKKVQRTIDKNTEKRIEQVARKTIRLATKVKGPKIFEQKYKTIEGKIFTYTLHNAWVQSFGKQPRLLRKKGT